MEIATIETNDLPITAEDFVSQVNGGEIKSFRCAVHIDKIPNIVRFGVYDVNDLVDSGKPLMQEVTETFYERLLSASINKVHASRIVLSILSFKTKEGQHD